MAKRIIFTLSPGRCGTGYLAAILRTIPSVAAFHEPKPRLHEVNEAAQFNFDYAREYWKLHKIPAVERLLINHSVYVETGHLFVNAWGKIPATIGQHIDLITLTRPHREVALSYWQRASVPGRTRRGLDFLIHPDAPHVDLRLHDWQQFNDYQLCYWHCLEVARRTENLVKIYGRLSARIAQTTLEEITTQDGFNQLVIDLRLGKPDWRHWREISDNVINANPVSYKRRTPKGDLKKMEREVERCLPV